MVLDGSRPASKSSSGPLLRLCTTAFVIPWLMATRRYVGTRNTQSQIRGGEGKRHQGTTLARRRPFRDGGFIRSQAIRDRYPQKLVDPSAPTRRWAMWISCNDNSWRCNSDVLWQRFNEILRDLTRESVGTLPPCPSTVEFAKCLHQGRSSLVTVFGAWLRLISCPLWLPEAVGRSLSLCDSPTLSKCRDRSARCTFCPTNSLFAEPRTLDLEAMVYQRNPFRPVPRNARVYTVMAHGICNRVVNLWITPISPARAFRVRR